MQVLELYCGIGGMHLALKESGVEGEIKAAIDINNVANAIYKHNFPETLLLNKNIQGLTVEQINKLKVDTILMSPPCQPFTRNGLQEDIKDARTDSFCHVLRLLPDLNIQNILIENVKGFEKSQMRDLLIATLKESNYVYQEFILSPSQIGVPNTRHRYYCLARKNPNKFSFDVKDTLMEHLPNYYSSTPQQTIKNILETAPDLKKYLIPDKILLKRAKILDVCYSNSHRSCCFTKAYGRYMEGTGSVFTEKSQEDVQLAYEELSKLTPEDAEYLKLIKSLELRFFTPKEVSRLMSFPETYSFPSKVTDRQCYMVLGNSINVKVVSELIKLFK